MPVPAGLTFVRVDREHMGDGTRSVSLDFRNPSMTCAQLDAAWKTRLAKENITITEDTGAQIFVKNSHYVVIILLGYYSGANPCARPSVGAETK